jgi:predicted O-linked N-acetylglucosamine transferase (SPINDLY family)
MPEKFNQIPNPEPKPKVQATLNSVLAQQVFEKLQQGLALHNAGQLEQSRVIYEAILKLDPKNFDALQLLGAIAVQTKKWDAALGLLNEALKISTSNASVYNNRGIVLKELNQLDAALSCYDKAIELNPNYAGAYSNRGIVLKELNQLDAALTSYDKAVELNPNYSGAYFNRGNALKELKQLEAALSSYDMAIGLKPDYPEAYYNRGIVLQDLKQPNAALSCYDKAIELNPNYAEAYSNRGNALQELNQLETALTSYGKAIELNPNYAEAYHNRGNALKMLQQLDAALINYAKTFELNPDFEYLYGALLFTKNSLCNWLDFKIEVEKLSLLISEGKKASQSFPVLALIDSPAVQRKASETWIKDKHPFNKSLGPIFKSGRHQKIKIGYYSADFRDHPVSILLAELFELHDKENFELIAFYSGPPDSSNMHTRVASAFDKFIDIRLKSDVEVARLSRDSGIDIAVDLTGLTQHSRVGIFSFRAAPIQLSYVGYLGTMGAEYYDYLIADKTIIPIESQQYYKEKIVYLPSYQVNDSKREIGNKFFTKSELHLPENRFVFCCFNNNYKITPPTFDGWMRILSAVSDSVLFLYAQNKWSEANLKLEAEKRGVSEKRLIFGNRIEKSEYLARYRVADLFLDTLPYNAGTTASDALWSGLPVLTCMGESFASRVAASLLNAIELPELITTTQEQYEATAIELATNPAKLKAIKDKLERNRLTTALFDTPRFTRHIEAAYMQMYDRYQADLEPDHIYFNK